MFEEFQFAKGKAKMKLMDNWRQGNHEVLPCVYKRNVEVKRFKVLVVKAFYDKPVLLLLLEEEGSSTTVEEEDGMSSRCEEQSDKILFGLISSLYSLWSEMHANLNQCTNNGTLVARATSKYSLGMIEFISLYVIMNFRSNGRNLTEFQELKHFSLITLLVQVGQLFPKLSIMVVDAQIPSQSFCLEELPEDYLRLFNDEQHLEIILVALIYYVQENVAPTISSQRIRMRVSFTKSLAAEKTVQILLIYQGLKPRIFNLKDKSLPLAEKINKLMILYYVKKLGPQGIEELDDPITKERTIGFQVFKRVAA